MVASLQALNLKELTPVLGITDLYQLKDQVYYFPANYSIDDKTVFLPLRRWDLIFTGDHINQPNDTIDRENINNLIPGPFNHLMVYMGKDTSGLAYALELNILSLEQGGTLSLICLGSDFGILRHPDTSYIHDKNRMTNRWARRFVDSAYGQILMNEDLLLEKLHNDLIMGFPYQLEVQYSGNLLDRNIYLIDDGFEGGSSCSDYWTTLFELYADLCIKNARMGVEEIVDYFRNDPQGSLTYVPPEISPFQGTVSIRQILSLGFNVVINNSHVYSCDNTEETGIVLPFLIMQSDMLEEIPKLNLPFITTPWFSQFFREDY